MFEGGGSGKPTAPQYTRFINNYNWYHMVSILANNDYLHMEKVLGENVQDCFSYLQYVAAKNDAEEAQLKFEDKLNKSKRKK